MAGKIYELCCFFTFETLLVFSSATCFRMSSKESLDFLSWLVRPACSSPRMICCNSSFIFFIKTQYSNIAFFFDFIPPCSRKQFFAAESRFSRESVEMAFGAKAPRAPLTGNELSRHGNRYLFYSFLSRNR
jgi:hypothetical protein